MLNSGNRMPRIVKRFSGFARAGASYSLYLIEYTWLNVYFNDQLKAEHLLVRQQCFPLNLMLVLLLQVHCALTS